MLVEISDVQQLTQEDIMLEQIPSCLFCDEAEQLTVEPQCTDEELEASKYLIQTYAVTCWACHAQGPQWTSEKGAIELWGKRADPEA